MESMLPASTTLPSDARNTMSWTVIVAYLNGTIEARDKPFIFFAVFLFALVAHATQLILPAFNADDIIQSQPASGDAGTFLAAGRWGYYFIYQNVFSVGHGGIFGGVLGVLLLVWANSVVAELIGLTRRGAIIAFLLIATISFYYHHAFSFDSTRVAYPLAGLFAVLGIKYAFERRYVPALILLAIAPSFYPSGIMIAATVLVCVVISRSLNATEPMHLLWDSFIRPLLVFITGGLLYAGITRLTPIFTDIPLVSRVTVQLPINPDAFQRLIEGIWLRASPGAFEMHYETFAINLSEWVILASFVFMILMKLKSVQASLRPILIMAVPGLIIAPAGLAILIGIEQFAPRTLLAYSLSYAFMAAFVIQVANEGIGTKLAQAVTALAVIINVGLVSIQMSNSAIDDYIATRNDYLATNRILSRIESVIGASGQTLSDPIPIVVRMQTAISHAPRGDDRSNRHQPWSREWIFRHVDPTYRPVPELEGLEILSRAGDRKSWPSPESVYVDNGTVVVLIN